MRTARHRLKLSLRKYYYIYEESRPRHCLLAPCADDISRPINAFAHFAEDMRAEVVSSA